jgi:hypothetical protein
MKISQQNYLALKAAIESVIENLDKSLEDFERELKQTGKYKDFNTRVVWDLFWNIPRPDRVELMDNLYHQQLTDTHINSALKKIVKEYKENIKC